MSEFNNYFMPADDLYIGLPQKKNSPDIEAPLFPLDRVGQSVTEGGRFGNLIQTTQAAIRAGAGSIELQTGMGGTGEPVGAEAYGRDARAALRELALANKVTLTSVHAPVQVGNLSGLGQNGFSDEGRKRSLDEIKKAIRFAADVAQGGAVVTHTGEFQRSMFDADWNKDGKWAGSFEANDEESQRSTVLLVDQRSGRLVQEVRRNQIIHRPVWNTAGDDYEYTVDDYDVQRLGGRYYGRSIKPGDKLRIEKGKYVDYEGRPLDVETRVPRWNDKRKEFEIDEYDWQACENDANEMNEFYGYKQGDKKFITAEEAAFRMQLNSRIAIAKGWSMNYSNKIEENLKSLDELKKSLDFYSKLEKDVPEEDRWQLQKEAASAASRMTGGLAGRNESKLPSAIIQEAIDEMRKSIESSREMAVGQEQEIREQKKSMENVISVNKYAKDQSIKSYAEAGIFAWRESKSNQHAKKDVFVAPENIFPEMGYGSHPDELIELVATSRKKMADLLSTPYAPVKSGKAIKDEEEARKINERWGTKFKAGDPYIDSNPDYQGISRKEAEKLAQNHIKATVDTQHLGMWWEYFKPLPNETEDKRRSRFNEWYKEQFKKLTDNNIIGNIHLVDSVGGGHHHLPMGQGDLPLYDAMSYLKKKGYLGSITSEGHGEEAMGAGRILLQTWKAMGSPIYSMGSYGASLAPGMTWGDMQQGYFGKTYPPNFIFGAYIPSNEFRLWSDVPME